MNKDNSEYDVIVVGGGASGIYASMILKKNGLRPLILEAQQNLGGRIMSHRIDENFYVELGAQWLAKKGQRRLAELVKAHGFKKRTNYSQGWMVHSDEGKISHFKENKFPLSLLTKLDSLRFTYILEQLLKTISIDQPWLEMSLDKISLYDWLNQNLWTSESKKLWINTFEQGLCCDLRKISVLEGLSCAKSLGGLKNLETADTYYFEEGLQNLFLKIVEQNEIDVLKGEPVVHILQDENRVYVSTPSRKLRAKYILLTIPPQKYKHINFEPEMPVDHMNMVDNFIQGSVTKVIAVYSRPWWREKGFSGLISSLTGPFDLVIDSSPTTNEKGVLVGLVTSSRSKGLKGKDLRAVFSNHLMNCFGESEPMSDFLVFDWNGSPYTLGGYSSRRRINEWHLCQDFLQRPLGRIYFSGSETALEWRGYIEGALESAERQAAKLVTVLKSS